MAAAQEVGSQRRGRGGKGRDGHKGKTGNRAHHIRHRQFALPEVLNGDKEQEPGDERKKTLYHHPKAHIEHFSEQTQFEIRQTVEGETAIIHFHERVNDEKEHRNTTRQRGSDGSTGNAERRTTEMAEHQRIVEHHIGQNHHCGVVLEHSRLCRAHEEGAKQAGHHAEIHAPHAPIQVSPRGFIHRI